MHLELALTSGTAMTLDARFTQLRRGDGLYHQDVAGGVGLGRGAAAVAAGGLGCAGNAVGGRNIRPTEAMVTASASIRNRRLAIQMSQRPAVVAALNRGVPRNMPNGIMTRLGRGALVTSSEEVGTFRSSAAFAAAGGGGGGGYIRPRSNSASRQRNNSATMNLVSGYGGGGTRRGRRAVGRSGQNRMSRPRGRSNSSNRMTRSGSLGRLSRAGSVSNLSRSASLNRLTRSQSLQSLSGWANSVFKGRGFGRGRRRGRGRGGGGGGGNSSSVVGGGVSRGFVSRRRDSFGRRGRGVGNRNGGSSVVPGNFRMNRGRSIFRGGKSTGTGGGLGTRNFRPMRNNNSFRFRGGGVSGRGSAAGFRGGRGGRGGVGGGSGGRGGRQKEQLPTKEALDMEIDEYMSTTKSHLDKELDSYMNQPVEEAVTTNQTNGTVTETWD